MVEEPLNIEVGPRTVPTIELLRKNLLSGEKVIFIDKNQGSVRELKKINETTKRKDSFLVGDGSKLPVRDGVAGTIFVKDYFGCHNKFSMESMKDDGTLDSDKREDVGENIHQEWYRALAPGGRVVILENATPPDINKLIDDFTKQGFILKEKYHGPDSANVLEEADELKKRGAFLKGGYSLVFEKPR